MNADQDTGETLGVSLSDLSHMRGELSKLVRENWTPASRCLVLCLDPRHQKRPRCPGCYDRAVVVDAPLALESLGAYPPSRLERCAAWLGRVCHAFLDGFREAAAIAKVRA